MQKTLQPTRTMYLVTFYLFFPYKLHRNMSLKMTLTESFH